MSQKTTTDLRIKLVIKFHLLMLKSTKKKDVTSQMGLCMQNAVLTPWLQVGADFVSETTGHFRPHLRE